MKVCTNKIKLEAYAYIIVQRNRIIHVDHRFLTLSGYEQDNIIGQDISQLCDHLLRLTFDIHQLDKGREETGFLFTKNLYPRKVTVKVKQEQNDIKVVGFKEDIHWHIENKFPYIDKLCNRNTTGVAVFAITPNIVLLKANENFLSFFDEPFNRCEHTIGRQIHEFVTGWKGSASEQIWKQLLESGEGFQINEYAYDRLDKGIIYLKGSLTPICLEDGMQYVIEVTEEITESVLNRKRIEEQNIRMNQQKKQLEMALQMKDEFFSMISHEFKTPLNVIHSAVQAMELICGDELSDKGKSFVNKIRQNTFQQLRLVNNILDISRMNSGQFKLYKRNLDIVFLSKAIIESIELYRKQKGIEITFVSEVNSEIIGIDDEKYERILLNLLSNAIKFTPKNGSIEVRLSIAGENICVEIEDNGIGIPTEKQKVIFDRFGQVESTLSRQAEGTGIGLSLVKKLVEAMGGSISVSSELGVGSTFTMMLPKATTEDPEMMATQLDTSNERLVHAINIEFSDIYLME